MKKGLLLILILGFISSCKKDGSIIPSNRLKASGSEKSAGAPCTFVLKPTPTRPVIGFLEDGDAPYLYSPFQSNSPFQNKMISAVFNPTGTVVYQVYNPNLFLGLPADCAGFVFTGLAVDRTNSVRYPSIILSRSRTSEHALYFAALDANLNYIINSTKIVNASFAPSSAGWQLQYIEYNNVVNKMYGIFYNPSTNESIIGDIDKATGTTVFVKSFPGVEFCGMDFNVTSTKSTVANNMYLYTGNGGSNPTTCKIYRLQLPTLATYSYTTTIPLTYISGVTGLGTFLAMSEGDGISDRLYIYTNVAATPTNIVEYSISGSTIVNTISQKNKLYLQGSAPGYTLGPDQGFGGEAYSDAAN